MEKIFVLRIRLLLLLSIVFLSFGVLQAKSDKWTETDFGSFKIEKFWESNNGGYTCTYTIVTYWNSTNKTFTSITVKATVFDKNGDVIDTNTRSFFEHTVGPIEPGFKDSVKIPVETEPDEAKNVSVGVKGREKK